MLCVEPDRFNGLSLPEPPNDRAGVHSCCAFAHGVLRLRPTRSTTLHTLNNTSCPQQHVMTSTARHNLHDTPCPLQHAVSQHVSPLQYNTTYPQQRHALNNASHPPQHVIPSTTRHALNKTPCPQQHMMVQALMIHKDHVSAVMDVSFSPTGQEFASGSYDRTVRVFPHRAGRSREVYHTKRMQRVFCVNFSADAR